MVETKYLSVTFPEGDVLDLEVGVGDVRRIIVGNDRLVVCYEGRSKLVIPLTSVKYFQYLEA